MAQRASARLREGLHEVLLQLLDLPTQTKPNQNHGPRALPPPPPFPPVRSHTRGALGAPHLSTRLPRLFEILLLARAPPRSAPPHRAALSPAPTTTLRRAAPRGRARCLVARSASEAEVHYRQDEGVQQKRLRNLSHWSPAHGPRGASADGPASG